MEIDALKKHSKINQTLAYWVDKIKSAASFLPAFVYYTLHKMGQAVTAAVPILFKCIYGSTYAALNLVRNVMSVHQLIVYGRHMRHNKSKLKSTKNDMKLEIYQRSYNANKKQFKSALIKFGLSGLAVGIGILTCIPGFNIAGIALMAVPFAIELAIDANKRIKQYVRDKAYKGIINKILAENKGQIVDDLINVADEIDILWTSDVKDSFLCDVAEIAQSSGIMQVKDFLKIKAKRYPQYVYNSVDKVKDKYFKQADKYYEDNKSLIKIDITKTTHAKKMRADKLLKDQKRLINGKISKFRGQIERKKQRRISFVTLVDTLLGQKKDTLKTIEIKGKTVYDKASEIRSYIRDNGYGVKAFVSGLKEQDIIRME